MQRSITTSSPAARAFARRLLRGPRLPASRRFGADRGSPHPQSPARIRNGGKRRQYPPARESHPAYAIAFSPRTSVSCGLTGMMRYPVRLHVLGDAITRPQAIAREPHDRDGLSCSLRSSLVRSCISHPCQPHQLSTLLRASDGGTRRFQRAQFDGADAHAPQFFHQPSEMFEHDADLLVAAFDQPHFVPGIIAAANQLQIRRSGAAAAERNARRGTALPARGVRCRSPSPDMSWSRGCAAAVMALANSPSLVSSSRPSL